MPELPEVETIVAELNQSGILGLRITCVDVCWLRTLALPDLEDFHQRLIGRDIQEVTRRGKVLVFHLSGPDTLLVHLRMTGQFFISEDSNFVDPHVRICISFEDGRVLCFRDTRKLGRWYLVENSDSILGSLGPEPFDSALTAGSFWKMLSERKRALKPLLLDQSFIAGLGNIYVDEALFDGRFHPLRISNTLSCSAGDRLLASIRKVLRIGLRNLGTSLGSGAANYYSVSGRQGRNQDRLQVFRRNGSPCPRCGSIIERMVVAQRGTHFCPLCQNLEF